MLNILINAYAVNPYWGSEPGMGWHWIVNIARYCNVYVITEGEWREEIDTEVAQLPYRDNIHFFYLPVSDKVRRMCWNQGDWRFYGYYRKWQEQALVLAREIINKHHIDIVHQLNMIGFREPGSLWKIEGIPFVWGPVGAMKDGVTGYYNDFSLLMRMKNRLKNIINNWQIRYYPLSNKAMRKASLVMAATSEVRDFIRRWHRDDVVLMNETGCYALPDGVPADRDDECMSLIWVGKFDPRKQLQIAIRTLACLKDKFNNVRLHVVGAGTPDQEERARQLARKLGCDDCITWHGKVPNAQVHSLMQKSSLLLFTSIDEGTPHVVLEAVQNHLPVICFDTCGQRDIVTEDTGVKIPLTYPADSVKRFTEAISQLINNPELLEQKRRNCGKCQPELLWDQKARRMVALYEQCLEKKQCDRAPHHN